MSKVIAFTGHRPQDMFGYEEDVEGNVVIKKWLFAQIHNIAKKHPDTRFISGGALGVDTWSAEAVLAVKKVFPLVTLEIAVPCLNQDKKWSKEAKQRYAQLLDDADKVTYVSKHEYTGRCMQDRNEYMVDQADCIIGVWKAKRSGGTWNCLEYAEQEGKAMLILHPFKRKVIKCKAGEPIFMFRQV